jgi:hypothetical protein
MFIFVTKHCLLHGYTTAAYPFSCGGSFQENCCLMCVLLGTYIFSSCKYIAKNEWPSLYKTAEVSRSSCTILHFQQKRARVSVPHLQQGLTWSVFSVLVILICNFLMTCKIGSLEICLFSVLLHLLRDALQILCPFFWVNLLSSLLLSFKSSLCILVSSPLSYRCFPNTFCQAAACLSYLQCLSQSRIEFHLSEVHLVDSFIHLLCFQCFIAEHKVIQVFSC